MATLDSTLLRLGPGGDFTRDYREAADGRLVGGPPAGAGMSEDSGAATGEGWLGAMFRRRAGRGGA